MENNTTIKMDLDDFEELFSLQVEKPKHSNSTEDDSNEYTSTWKMLEMVHTTPPTSPPLPGENHKAPGPGSPRYRDA